MGLWWGASGLEFVGLADATSLCYLINVQCFIDCVHTGAFIPPKNHGALFPHSHFPPLTVFTVRRSALHGLWDRNSVRLSVTLVDCVHMVRPTIMISSPYGSPIILVSGDITIIPKFEGGHTE